MIRSAKAQTAIELAVFGAILIFVVGLIVRQSLEAGYQQNQNFRAMRLAMKTSYEYSEGLAGWPTPMPEAASRNRASVLVIEDRLTADSSKYSAIDRSQYVTAGGATHSRTLSLAVDMNEVANLPVYDVFVNGRHFPFSLAGFKTIRLAEPCRNRSDCPAHPECNNDCGPSSIRVFPGSDVPPGGWVDNCAQSILTRACRAFAGTCADDCTGASCAAPTGPVGCTNCCTDCSPTSRETYEETYTAGCARMFGKTYNSPTNESWCSHDGPPAGGSCDPICPVPPAVGPAGCNLSAGARFDLDRDGTPFFPLSDVTAAERPYFSWQWIEVMGFDEGAKQTRRVNRYYTTLTTGEGINFGSGKNILNVDVDGDLKGETILLDTIVRAPDSAVITRLGVLDDQEGDLDFTIGDNENRPEPGLTRDVRMYSFVRPGTYFMVEEGALYDPADGQFIRNVSKKDQIDIVERILRVSKNTGRFCFNGVPTNWSSPPSDSVTGLPVISGVSGMTNPVEACNDCFSSTNIQSTCMDEAHLLIFVRSRIYDLRGRKWITPTGGDDYVDFTVPSVP